MLPQSPAPWVEAFAARFGSAPQVVTRAPGRVNLIGEHVDYNGGRCLPMALEASTYAAASPRTDGRVRVASQQADTVFEAAVADVVPGKVDGWAAYAAGVLWALREDGIDAPGLDLLVDGRVPQGSGLSSSAALECSVALAAATLAGVPDDAELRRRLVGVCVRTEGEMAGAPTGGMDQTVSLMAEAGHALLIDFHDFSLEQVPWTAAAAGLELLVVNTRVQHALSDQDGDGGYAARRADCEQAAARLDVRHLAEVTDQQAALAGFEGPGDERLLRRVRHVLTELDRVDAAVRALRAGDFAEVGRLFVASHASLRDDYQVSCAELDVAVDTALGAGALGARMTGGGFGGCAIALIPAGSGEDVGKAVTAAFAERGWRDPEVFTTEASGPAERLL